MVLLITYNEQQTIKPISANNEDRFAQIMEETQINELQSLLGWRLYQDLIQNFTSAQNLILLDGKVWTYDDQSLKMHGLKYVLAHYYYSNYATEIKKQDTFSGFVKHDFDESNPVTVNEEHATKKRARETASKFWEEVKLYLDNNQDIYTYWYGRSGDKIFHPKISRLTKLHTNDIDTITDMNFKRNCCP